MISADLTIALTVENISLMMTQITSGRRSKLQNDFKLIVHSPKHTKISNIKNSTLEYVGICGRILIFYEPLGSAYTIHSVK
jgi:hypothetical protein